MVDYRRSEIVSGLFIVLAVLVFALFALKVGSFDLFAPFRGDVVSCRAYLHDIKTLEKGAKVTVGGRTVGSCTGHGFVSREMRLEDLSDLVDLLGKGVDLPEKLTLQIVEVRFELDDPELRLDPETASVSLAQDGFLGTHYLRLHPGHWTAGNAPARLLEAGIDDLVITAHDAAGIDGLLAQLQPILAQVGGILTKTNEQFLSKSNMEAATNLLGELDRATRSLRQLLDSEQPKGLWKSLLEPARKLIVNADLSLARLTERLMTVTMSKAESLIARGESLAESADQAILDARTLLRESSPKIGSILDDLAETSSELRHELGSLLAQVRGVITDNRAQVAEILRRMRRTMWQAEMAVRKIRGNPAFLLFGDEEADLEEKDMDLGRIRSSGRARPYMQRDEKDGGK